MGRKNLTLISAISHTEAGSAYCILQIQTSAILLRPLDQSGFSYFSAPFHSWNQQIVKKGKGQVPIKSSDERLCDIQKYGGYNKEAGAYFVLAESEGKKGKKIRTIEYVPIRLKKEIQKSEENIIRYLEGRAPSHLLKMVFKLPSDDGRRSVLRLYNWVIFPSFYATSRVANLLPHLGYRFIHALEASPVHRRQCCINSS